MQKRIDYGWHFSINIVFETWRFIALCVMLMGLAECTFAAATKLPTGMTERRRIELPGMSLRGYGRLSGNFVLYESPNGGQCSQLVIQCEDPKKAQIVHAKYLSDLGLLLPVENHMLRFAGVTLKVVKVPDQGVIVAFQKGTQVCVFAGTDEKSLELVFGLQPNALKGAGLTPVAKVPMYLDSFDKYGFRFYYRPGTVPPAKPGKKRVEWKDYNVLGEFDFAKKYDNGFIFWQNEDNCDFAEGMRNNRIWEFGARACANRNLPVIVNSTVSSSSWLVNRYRDQTQWKMPGYCGEYYMPGDAYHAGNRKLAWSADEGLDAVLAVLQKTWRDYSIQPTTIEYLEPHGELRHGDHDILNEYGPQADKTFRAFLKETYGQLSAVSQRWFGKPDALGSWDEVRVPEVASFFGHSKAAFDLDGEWKFQYEQSRSDTAQPIAAAPQAWYLPSLEDAKWPSVAVPSEIQLFLPNGFDSMWNRPSAVWRKHFTLSDAWTVDNPRVWLYIFSLNRGKKELSPVYLNGKKIAEPKIQNDIRPVIVEVTGILNKGENLLALRLPNSYLGYRVYLTQKPPAEYPYLGEYLNAQWVDFVRWHAGIRRNTIRRSMDAIREVDPDRSIICMAPDSFISEIEELCQDYGARFHNTGHMSGWWNEMLPMMMRSAEMPFSAEPGGPAKNLSKFKSYLGHWLTEGVNAIHYFIHVGDVYWSDEIRTWFEENQAIIGAFGKMHVPKAEVAMLYGDDVRNLTGWPWRGDSVGYIPHQFNVALHKEYHMDAVSIKDFGRGFADSYRVILDTNTTIMDEATVLDIEEWVKRGGVFVTIDQTGRHTPEKADSWPINRLTGYEVVNIKVHPERKQIEFAEGQKLYRPEQWDEQDRSNNGLELKPLATECETIATWPNGTVAIGQRKIGKGKVIHIGCRWRSRPLLLSQLLESLGIGKVPGYCEDEKVNSTHEVSNNGLYDIWITWNREQQAKSDNLTFRDGALPAYCIDLKTREKLVPVVSDGTSKITNLTFGPGDIRILAAPRGQIATAPLDWFNLQRGWWRGTKQPKRKLPAYEPRFALELDEQWLMKPLDDKDKADHSAMAAIRYDDTDWAKSDLGCWLIPEDLSTHRIFFRKRFTVPKQWNNGEIDLWLCSWQGNPVMGQARLWLDGKELESTMSQDLTAQLKPGKEYLLAVELMGENRQIIGFRGNMWLAYLPKPDATVDLGGMWTAMATEGLTFDKDVTLPGTVKNLAMVKRRVRIEQSASGKTVMFWMDASGLVDLIINGHYLRRHHHRIGSRTSLNITPWIKFGEENEFIIPCRRADSRIGINSVQLRYFTLGEYPW